MRQIKKQSNILKVKYDQALQFLKTSADEITKIQDVRKVNKLANKF